MSNSQEEEIARDYICFGNPDCTIVVVDATCLERNLNLVYQILEITNKVIVCVNLLDEAKKKGIQIDLDKLSNKLGIPVVGTIARKKKTLNNLIESVFCICNKEDNIYSKKDVQKNILFNRNIKYIPVIEECISLIENEVSKILLTSNFNNYRWISLKLLEKNENIIKSIEEYFHINLLNNSNIQKAILDSQKILNENSINDSILKDKIVSSILFISENVSNEVINYKRIDCNNKKNKIDKILTSKITGIPIMIVFFALIFWITITGANYPSQLLSKLFIMIELKLVDFFQYIKVPNLITQMLVFGMYRTLAWIVAVMLPPMAIFFPLFTVLEDLGYLPRIAFNLDGFFKKACTSGKQALTMCMGFGCNAAGVVGCRIIDSPREKLIAIITNSFVPCNRKISFFNYYCNYIYWWNIFWINIFFAFYFGCSRNNYLRCITYVSYIKNTFKNDFERFTIIICFRVATF